MNINSSYFPIILSILAGLSTTIGAFIVFFSSSKNEKLIAFALAFSSGVMISISFTDLIPTAQCSLIKYYNNFQGIIISLLFFILGTVIAMLIDNFIPEYNEHISVSKNNSLYKVGFVSTIALFLHNFPEGIATYVSAYQNTTLGIYVALAIALHNIPEGISIAMPIYYSTDSKAKAFKYTFLSGIAEPVGAVLAFIFLKPYINEIVLSILFLLVAGIMLYIAFQELMPKSKAYGYNFIYIASLVLGICTIPISHIFL